jgi:purine-binding chemotaxis protein CheW
MPEAGVAPGESSVQEQRFLTIRVGERHYALAADDVAEITLVPKLTRVPHSPPALLGVGNLRGTVLPVASLRIMLAISEDSVSPNARAVVIGGRSKMAVVVDSVDTLVTLASDEIEGTQAQLSAEPGELIIGGFHSERDHTPIKILDLQALLAQSFAQHQRIDRHKHLASHVGERSGGRVTEAVAQDMLVTFDVAGQEFALDLAVVQEVLPSPPMRTSVPRADALVLGVTSLRGSLLPLLSLRALLGFPPATAFDEREKVLVTNISGAQVGLVADRTRGVEAADQDLIDQVPTVLAARMGGESRIRAIYRGDAGHRLISILAPEQIFREDVMQRLRSTAVSQPSSRAGDGEARDREADYLVFRLGDDEFALPIEAVVEVAQVPDQLTRVPKTPKFLEGVINLRGTVLPVIDQRQRFELGPAPAQMTRRLVVVKTDTHRAGLIVDSVSDVLRAPDRAIQPAPQLTEDIARLVRNIIQPHDSARIILLLDPLELLTRAERGLLDEFERHTTQVDA